MKKINLLGYVLGVCLMALVSFFVSSCATEELEENEIIPGLNLITNNYTGYSTGELQLEPTGITLGNIRIDLAKTQIEVTAEKLGKLSLTSQTDPSTAVDSTAVGKVTKRGTKKFNFSDGQIATAVWQYLYELAAKYHWEITEVIFKNYTSELVEDGKIARIILNFDVICKRDGETPDVKTFTLSPAYYQYVKGAQIDDNAIVNTYDEIGRSTGDVTAIDAAFTAKVWLNLAQKTITVKKDQFGKVDPTLLGTPHRTAVSPTDSIGEKITFSDGFSDKQVAKIEIRNVHHKNAKFYYSITELKYIDYTVTTVSDKQCLITLHYRGTYVHSDGSKKGTFDLYPKYYQKLEDEPAQLTWKVDSTYTILSDGSMIWYGKLTRSDGLVKEKRAVVAFVGDVHGRYVFGVSEAKVIKKNDSHKKRTEMCTTEKDGDWTITTDYETWRWERFFANPQNLDLTTETEIVFWTKQLTFKDPETGWTLTTKPLVKNCEITADEIYIDSSAPSTKEDQGHSYTYVGSHRLAVKNTVDGNTIHSSTGDSRLFTH